MAGKRWGPQIGPQLSAIRASRCIDELFYGGARGGGKSIFLLLDFVQDVPYYKKDWHGVLFRRTYPQFAELVKMSQEMYHDIYGKRAQWLEGSYTWKFPGGSTLRFRHIDKDSDADNHLGESNQWLGVDEITQFPSDVPYKKLLATLRSTSLHVPKRVRLTGNPGGSGHGWVRKRFIEMAPEGYRPFRSKSTKMVRVFIPSKVTDNRILMKADPEYVGRLKAAAAGNLQLLKAWLYGDWDVFFGRFFSSFDPQVHKVDPLKILPPDGLVPPNWSLEGCLDYGEAKPTAVGLMAKNEKGQSYVIAEYYKEGLWLSEHAAGIRALISHCPYTHGRVPSRIWADPQIWYTRASANWATMTRTVADVFRRDAGLRLVKANRDRVNGWRFLKNELAFKRDPGTGEITQPPKIFYFPECEVFERTMLNAVYAGTEDAPSEDMDTDCEDHWPDAMRYYAMGAHSGKPVAEEPEPRGLCFDDYMKRARMEQFGITKHDVPMITPAKRPEDPIYAMVAS